MEKKKLINVTHHITHISHIILFIFFFLKKKIQCFIFLFYVINTISLFVNENNTYI